MAQAEIGSAPFLLGILVCILWRDGQSQKQRARVPAPHGQGQQRVRVPAPHRRRGGRVIWSVRVNPARGATELFRERTIFASELFRERIIFPR